MKTPNSSSREGRLLTLKGLEEMEADSGGSGRDYKQCRN